MSLEKYSIEKLIGKGSYGEVFLAKHKKDKRRYVVKKVSLQKASERERKAAELEAKLLSQLRHPNIVSYRESFQGEAGFLYIVMNYCEGGDLYTRLKAQKSTLLDEKQIVEWFVQIAMALQYMHEKHILHRDLKTQNIFLTRSKIIKLGDLGIAKVLEKSTDMATTLIGTPYYMSPELFSNKPYNHKSDVWALGCCLYEMCTLKHAFNAKDMSSLVCKILKGKTPPLPKQYSADLCSIIANMLDQNPEKRPSVSRLLRHPYIKKQIAAFLEGTKNRQKQKSEQRKISSPKKETTRKSTSSSVQQDSGYSEVSLQSSIATVSGVDCIIEDNSKPAQTPPVPLIKNPHDSVKHVERSQSESDVTHLSTESSSSSGPSEKEQNEECKDGQMEKKEREKEWEKEAIRKQMAQRRKSASETKDKISENRVQSTVDKDKKQGHLSAKKPLRQVKSAGSSRTPVNGVQPVVSRRPLPRPPVAKPRISANEAPLSRSPRARRRYKISSRAHSIDGANEENEEDDDDDKSTASVDSDKSSASDSSSKLSGLSARERRRLRQSASGSPLHHSPDSYNTPPLPSPLEIRNRKSQKQASKGTPNSVSDQRSSVSSITSQDSVDGPPRPQQKAELESSEGEDTGSDLEEVTPGDAVLARKRGNSDVSSLISALDSTLKLDDRSADRVSPEIEDGGEEEESKDELLQPTGASPTTSGRFRNRLERLKMDCLRGIGEEMLLRAFNIIDSVGDDEVENELVKYMGKENFEKYGGSIWQLNFYENSRKS